MKAGMKVKYTDLAFKNGVAVATEAKKDLRGIVLREKRNHPSIWVVKWDDRKQPEYLHRDFITEAR